MEWLLMVGCLVWIVVLGFFAPEMLPAAPPIEDKKSSHVLQSQNSL
jgi:hypothetical protein